MNMPCDYSIADTVSKYLDYYDWCDRGYSLGDNLHRWSDEGI